MQSGGQGHRSQPLVVPRHHDDRQSDRKQRDRTHEHPVRQTQSDHQRVDDHKRRRRGNSKQRRHPHRIVLLTDEGSRGLDGLRVGRRDPDTRRHHRLERRKEFLGALPPVGRFLLQALHDQLSQRGGHRLPMLGDRFGDLGDMRRKHRLRRRSGKRRASRQQFIGENAYGIDVRAMVNVWVSDGLLGSHVRGRAEGDTRRRELLPPGRLTHRLRNTEIRH